MSFQNASALPECVVCTDILEDPRQLPCGHCYCGPPKNCMNALKHNSKLKCFLCGIENKIKISDLKPLYGLRDYLSEQKSAISKKSNQLDEKEIYCEVHKKSQLKYWCKSCEELICANCIDSSLHQNHDFVSFRHNFRTILPIILRKYLPSKEDKLTDLKRSIAQSEKFIKQFEKLVEMKTKVEAEVEEINLNWQMLESLISGSDTTPDMKLIKWLMDRETFKVSPTVETFQQMLNKPNEGTECGIQAVVIAKDQISETEPLKIAQKGVGTEPIALVVKETQTVDVGLSANDPTGNCRRGSENDEDSDKSSLVSGTNLTFNFRGHQNKVPFPIKSMRSILICFPLCTFARPFGVVWSDELISYGGVFSLGIARVNNCLAVHLLPEYLLPNREVTVSFDRFTGKWFHKHSKFWIWRDLDTDISECLLSRYTDVPWVQFLDRRNDRIAATVIFSKP